ncbi:MAG: hypothetical protein AAF266_01745 [Planctomycetota bacterium]
MFNDGSGNWDNNSGADWHFTVTGGVDPVGFVMDGVLDEGAMVFATEDGRTIWYALEGDTLYLATNDAGEGEDVFLYLADTPGELGDANWGKAGQVAGWDAFIADENDNDYEGWFDNEGSAEVATGPNGGVLEATIDLVDEFGEVPEEVYLALAHFATGDGGSLEWLLNELSANGSIEANEYLRLELATAGLPGDYNGDGVVNTADYVVWRDALQTGDLAADGDGDGDVDADDVIVWQENFGRTAAEPVSAVPEPAGIALLVAALLAAAKSRR